MKTAIVYISTHHGNTKKIVEAIGEKYDVVLIDGEDNKTPDLTNYDCIGFASGIAYAKFYQQMLNLMEVSLPKNKKVFFLYTCGTKQNTYTKAAHEIAETKECTILGEYGCLGFDTYGLFKLIGGISKGHPNEKEIAEALEFYDEVINL